MMDWLELVRVLHVLGGCVLIGTGAGIAFFMLMAHRSQTPIVIAHVAAVVVIADTIFTATAAIAQPITGLILARATGWPLHEGWLALSLALYVFIGAFWLPVVVIQIKMRDEARIAVKHNTRLSPRYHRLYRFWFACGIPAFGAIVILLWLMTIRPDISWGLG